MEFYHRTSSRRESEASQIRFPPSFRRSLYDQNDCSVIDHLASNGLKERYFQGRDDQLAPAQEIRIVRCRLN